METICALLVFTLALTAIKPVKSQSCSSFTYTQHPPIPLNCKPFSNDPSPTWQLRTECVVERDTTNTAAFEVHWIHRNSNGVEEDLGLPGFSLYIPDVPFAQSNGPRMVGTPFTESMVGQYWCQAFFTNGSPLPVHSDTFTVLRPEEYDSQIPVCPTSLVRDVRTNICNDEPPPPLPSAATTSSTSSSVKPTSSSSSQQPLQTSIVSTSMGPTTSTTDHSTVALSSIKQSSLTIDHTNAQQPSAHTPSASTQVPLFSTTWLSSSSLSKDKTSTTYTQIQPSSTDISLLPTINVTTANDETPAGINVLLSYHSLYVVAIMAIVAVSGLLVLTVCMRRRIKKAFVKKSVNVDMLEITSPHNTNTTATPTATQTAIPVRAHSQETLRSQCRTLRPLLPLPTPPVSVASTSTDNSSEYYEAIYDSTSGSIPEYIMVIGDTQYESLQGDTMDYIPGYCMANKDAQYKSLQTNTMNPVHKYSSVANMKTA